jgi:hypothetical protein
MSAMDDKPMNAVARSLLAPDGDRLDSWKEIAVYLHREVRTAERWEKREGLPVHRHTHPNGSSVYAFKHEIDAWLRSRCPAASGSAPQEKHLERAQEWLSPTQLTGTRRTTVKSRAWLQNASAGVGSLDLLHGEERVRLYFYVQLRAEQEANSKPKISGTRGKA